MIAIYTEDPYFYQIFKSNIIRYGVGKLSVSLFDDLNKLLASLEGPAVETSLMLIQSENELQLPGPCRMIRIEEEDRYDAQGRLLVLSLCRSFDDLMERIAAETYTGFKYGIQCKTFYGICDGTISMASLYHRLGAMAVQYNRQVLLLDLDLQRDQEPERMELQTEGGQGSERAICQLLNRQPIHWSGLAFQEFPLLYLLKPFRTVEDAQLLNESLLTDLKEAAEAHGIEFIVALHKGTLCAPSFSLSRLFDERFVLGESFEDFRQKVGRMASQDQTLFFTSASTRHSADLLSGWHIYMNGHMKHKVG